MCLPDLVTVDVVIVSCVGWDMHWPICSIADQMVLQRKLSALEGGMVHGTCGLIPLIARICTFVIPIALIRLIVQSV